MVFKKKSTRPRTKAKVVAAGKLETAYPFEMADCDYRVNFRNGLSVVYHGSALASNPHVPVAEIVQVAEENTGNVIFTVPREKEPEEKPGFYRAE